MRQYNGNQGFNRLLVHLLTLTVRSLSIILLLPIVFSRVAAVPWPERVVEVHYGPGAGFGQEQFPVNILGPPDPNSSERVPSSDPNELLTLGSGGWIILAFEDLPIQDDTGADFTVFENPFWSAMETHPSLTWKPGLSQSARTVSYGLPFPMIRRHWRDWRA